MSDTFEPWWTEYAAAEAKMAEESPARLNPEAPLCPSDLHERITYHICVRCGEVERDNTPPIPMAETENA